MVILAPGIYKWLEKSPRELFRESISFGDLMQDMLGVGLEPDAAESNLPLQDRLLLAMANSKSKVYKLNDVWIVISELGKHLKKTGSEPDRTFEAFAAVFNSKWAVLKTNTQNEVAIPRLLSHKTSIMAFIVNNKENFIHATSKGKRIYDAETERLEKLKKEQK